MPSPMAGCIPLPSLFGVINNFADTLEPHAVDLWIRGKDGHDATPSTTTVIETCLSTFPCPSKSSEGILRLELGRHGLRTVDDD